MTIDDWISHRGAEIAEKRSFVKTGIKKGNCSGSQFTVSDLAYRKNQMNSASDSESNPSEILYIDGL